MNPAATLETMHPALKALGGLDELDRVLAASSDRPLLLFKYSATCGTSAEALDELVAHLNESPADATYAIVTVQTHRDVSNAVASKLGVRHETPQALLIRDGRVVWSASHFRVTAAALEKALQEAIDQSQPVVQ
jgi:bacillithiol system protein YtxJ